MKNRFLRFVMIIMVFLMMIPSSPVFAEDGGSFYLMAASQSKMIISPTKISYEKGMTIRDALMASEYDFAGIDTGFIYAIEGYSASFSLFYDGGGYVLDIGADEISVLAFMESGEYYSEELLSAIKLMAQFSGMTNNVTNYTPAKNIYEKALDDMRTADKDTAKSIYANLSKAISDYETIINGKKYDVTFNAVKGNTPAQSVSLTLTDEYGNVTTSGSNTAKVIAGKYKYVITDNGINRAEGNVTINGNTSVNVKFPASDWFGDIKILNPDEEPYEYTQDKENHKATYIIPDSVGWSGLYINAGQGNVIDPNFTRLRAIYVDTNGTDKSDTVKSWESVNTSLPGVLTEGLEGRTITIEAQYTVPEDEGGYEMIQEYELEFVRKPTLSSLSVMDGRTHLLTGFEPTKSEYDITSVNNTLTVDFTTFGEGYEVTVNGSKDKVIDLSGKNSYKAEITVKKGNLKNTYTVNISKVIAADVRMVTSSGVTVEVYNQAGSLIESEGDNKYKLVPGEKYTYISTKNTYFHTSETFTAKDGISVTVATPEVKDGLKDFAFYNTSGSNRIEYGINKTFDTAQHEYVYTVTDMNSTGYAQASPVSGYEVKAIFTQQSNSISSHGKTRSPIVIDKIVDRNGGSAKFMTSLLAKSGYSQKFTIRLEKMSGGVTYYQDYLFDISRSLHINSFALTATGEKLVLMNSNGAVLKENEFDHARMDYYVSVPSGTGEIVLHSQFPNELTDTPCCGGYYAMIQGEKYENISEVTLNLDITKEKEDIVIEICHADEKAVVGKYTIHITQQEPVYVEFATNPSDAIVYVKNNVTGKRVNEKDGKFALNPNSEYTYTVTRNGYIGEKNEEYIAPDRDKTVSISLKKAQTNENVTVYDSWWSSFRADKNNNGIIEAKTPITAEDTVLYWATKIGDGFDKNACGCPIIVDGYLYTYAGTTIYKVDTLSGEIVATGEMDHSSSFAINPPTYADGMIFVGLAEGCVQAFSAETLESLWMYRDEIGGQPNCPIYYHDGYIYTGFWLGEVVDANYVCLSVTDEDPANKMESKIPTWTYTSKGGFYWAGAFVNDNFAIVGTDDGDAGYTSGYANVVTFSTKTGEVIDTIRMPFVGDIRSSIVYDENADEYYFTSKGGYFYGLKTDKNGQIIDSSLRYIRLQNGANIATAPPMSTSSPAIYNGRAYVGVSGISQFGPYTGHNISVLDLKYWEVAYTVQTQGYPQTSGILTTAYEDETGLVYVYFIDNYTPGKLRVISDKPGQTRPNEMTTESFTSGGKTNTYETAYVLFTPDGEQAQYAICSPIIDEYGTLYFKNDSAYLMAVGSTVEKLEITEKPAKLTYDEGDLFDPTGMKVVATFENGLTKDVTEYITFSDQPLTPDDEYFQILFSNVMYQNMDGMAGQLYTAPIAFTELEIIPLGPPVEPEACDLNEDGKVNADDLSKVLMDYKLTESVSDVNADGIVDARDISNVLRHYGSVITTKEQQ